MARLDWQNMAPMDTSRYLDAMARAQQTTQNGLAQVGKAFEGYYGDLKDRNTNEMLTLLNSAQSPEELANVQSQIAGLQQRYGNGYDMKAVRDAVDVRPDQLLQRQTNQMEFDQKQKAVAAIGSRNQAFMQMAKAQGASAEELTQMQAVSDMGVDISDISGKSMELAWKEKDFNNENFWKQKNFDEGVRQFGVNSNFKAVDQAASLAGQYADGEGQGGGTFINGNGDTVSSGGSNKFAKYMGMVSPIVLGMAGPESNYRHTNGKGELTTSRAGAKGMTQFMPKTRQMMIDKYGVDPWKDEDSAIKAADLYHKENLALFKGDEAKAIAAYNAGPGRVQQAVAAANKAGKPDSWLSRLPQETQNHVPKVMKSAQKYGFGGGGSTADSGTTGMLPMESYQKISGKYNENKLKFATDKQKADVPLDPSRFDRLGVGAERNLFTKDGRDVADAIRKNPLAQNLNEDSLQKVYKAAEDWATDTKWNQRVYDGGLETKINNLLTAESKLVTTNRKHNDSVNHPIKAAILELQQEFRAKGGSISEANAAKLLDQDYYAANYASKAPATKAVNQAKAKAVAPKNTTVKNGVVVSNAAQPKPSTPQAKPSKEDVINYMVKRGATSVVPNGIDVKKDKALIREASEEARKRMVQNESKAKDSKESKAKAKEDKAKAEIAKLRKAYADKQAAKIAAERRKLKEEEAARRKRKEEELEKLRANLRFSGMLR